MATLMQAANQWASRPADERFLSLTDMFDTMQLQRNRSAAKVMANRGLRLAPAEDHAGLFLQGPTGAQATLTHWSFGQLASLSDAPAGYLRKLPSDLAADCLNYGLQIGRGVEDVGVLLTKQPDDTLQLRAATGPRYGRIWNHEIVSHLIDGFGDGVTGDFRVPGEFGKAVAVTKQNTTLYAGDRDMFVFLADETNRIEVPNRRNGEAGSMARGFFVWNSEVGAQTFGVAMFLFDYVCQNRIVWGAEGYREIRIRHSAGAPDKWLEQAVPVLEDYRQSGTSMTVDRIKAAQEAKLGDRLDAFLGERFGRNMVDRIKAAHVEDEDRPIETVWDAVTGATALARSIQWQDDRVALERQAGKLLDLVAN